jgi:WD40 repeat protein
VSGGTDGCLKLWDLRAGRIVQYYEAHRGAVTDAAFHPSGSFLLSSSLDGALKASLRAPREALPPCMCCWPQSGHCISLG